LVKLICSPLRNTEFSLKVAYGNSADHFFNKKRLFLLLKDTNDMIQRIQTVLLFLTTILAALFLSGIILTFADGSLLSLKGISDSSNVGMNVDLPILTVILLLVPFVSFVTIFLYKNRRLQMKLTIVLIILIILEIAVVAYYSYTLIVAHNTELGPGAKMILPPVMLILAILAYRGIRKDENLVKSYDRLR
jgi:hypothetical protein